MPGGEAGTARRVARQSVALSWLVPSPAVTPAVVAQDLVCRCAHPARTIMRTGGASASAVRGSSDNASMAGASAVSARDAEAAVGCWRSCCRAGSSEVISGCTGSHPGDGGAPCGLSGLVVETPQAGSASWSGQSRPGTPARRSWWWWPYVPGVSPSNPAGRAPRRASQIRGDQEGGSAGRSPAARQSGSVAALARNCAAQPRAEMFDRTSVPAALGSPGCRGLIPHQPPWWRPR